MIVIPAIVAGFQGHKKKPPEKLTWQQAYDLAKTKWKAVLRVEEMSLSKGRYYHGKFVVQQWRVLLSAASNMIHFVIVLEDGSKAFT